MTGFVASTPTATESTIHYMDFYPDIDPALCRDVMRIDSSVTPARLAEALTAAILDVDDDLRAWREQQEENGHSTLADVPAPTINGESRKLSHFKRAVFCLAKAEVTERYRDFDNTLDATQRAEALDQTIDQYRRMARLAVRQILEAPATNIELI